MQMRRQADVYERNAFIGEDFFEIRRYADGRTFASHRPCPLHIKIADRLDGETLRQRQITAQMLCADTGADNGDADHAAVPSALACA
ncbi:hypothetical protein D3C86_1734630 [compost metagenome]